MKKIYIFKHSLLPLPHFFGPGTNPLFEKFLDPPLGWSVGLGERKRREIFFKQGALPPMLEDVFVAPVSPDPVTTPVFLRMLLGNL